MGVELVELVAFTVLGAAAAYLGISDLKRRAVDIRAVFACYVLSACVNGVVFASCPSCDGADPIRAAAGSIIAILFLSGAMVAFHRIGLVASGDALAVPALLSMLTFVASPVEILSYFVSAMAFVLAAFTAKNVINNRNHVGSASGPLWRRLYLLVFCYYGSGDSCRYAFRYAGRINRDYDSESYYAGAEKVWLVPGYPLLCGFAPAIVVLSATAFLNA